MVPLWQSASDTSHRAVVIRLADHLELCDRTLRMRAARAILYIAQVGSGSFGFSSGIHLCCYCEWLLLLKATFWVLIMVNNWVVTQLKQTWYFIYLKMCYIIFTYLQGCWGEVQSDREQAMWARRNVFLLVQCGVWSSFLQLLHLEMELVHLFCTN